MANCSYADCLIAPIPSKCFLFCIHQILSRATPKQKRTILRLAPTTAESVFRAYNSRSISSFEELAESLNSSQVREILDIFRNITQEQLNALTG